MNLTNSVGIPIVDGILGIIKGGQERGLKEAEVRADLEKSLASFEASVIASTNATMQAEAKSEHWPQWLWRPFIGFVVGLVMLNNYVLVTYLQQWGARPVPIDAQFWIFSAAVLGVAAYTRGREKEKREEARIETIRANGNGQHTERLGRRDQ